MKKFQCCLQLLVFEQRERMRLIPLQHWVKGHQPLPVYMLVMEDLCIPDQGGKHTPMTTRFGIKYEAILKLRTRMWAGCMKQVVYSFALSATGKVYLED
jgi:hypothetical protein